MIYFTMNWKISHISMGDFPNMTSTYIFIRSEGKSPNVAEPDGHRDARQQKLDWTESEIISC